MWLRMLLLGVCLVAGGCGRDADIEAVGRADALGQVTLAPSNAVAGRSINASRPTLRGFADLPDHGELLAYPGQVSRRDGAYTWHRADMSEQYALRAIADGHLRITTPSGELLDFRYDRHVEHPSGDWTWIGHLPGHEGEQTILTFGDRAAFGSIARTGKPALRLTVRDGVSWLVETDPREVAAIVNAATRPQQPDYHIVSQADLPHRSVGPRAAADGSMAGAGDLEVSSVSATATGTSTVDLIIGYTSGFAAANGSASGALTRLNYLVDVANAAYANSEVAAKVRLVKALEVVYTDSNDNGTALEQMSGYKSGSGPVTPNAAFNALRNAREQYGADLVSLVRDFHEPENSGCGIAWLLGGSLQGIGAGEGWDELGYSVVSDGIDAGTDGKNYFCRDETLAHEMGHNMGAAHDRAAAEGDDGTLDNPDDYGAYTYSFGYKASSSDGNFYTVMAYGDSGQRSYRAFSSPGTTFCGGRACGTSSNDNARTLANTVSFVANFRVASSYPVSMEADFDGDGKSDLLWRNTADGRNVIWRSGNAATQSSVATVPAAAWKIAGVGDFNGDGRSDILWRNTDDGRNAIWRSGNAVSQQAIAGVVAQAWKIAGVGDFDGDGRSDILWRNAADGRNAIWKSGNASTQQGIAGVAVQAWKIAGLGDFDGDGRSDILWRNMDDGRNAIWKSGNASTQQSITPVAARAWKIVGVGDFDGNGRYDILWRDTGDGRNAIWKAGNAANQQAVTNLGDLSWQVAYVADYGGDGRADILWRNNPSGENMLWESGNSGTSKDLAAVASASWIIAPNY